MIERGIIFFLTLATLAENIPTSISLEFVFSVFLSVIAKNSITITATRRAIPSGFKVIFTFSAIGILPNTAAICLTSNVITSVNAPFFVPY